MAKANRGGWKTCVRGHKYRGSGGCPICWKKANPRRPAARRKRGKGAHGGERRRTA